MEWNKDEDMLPPAILEQYHQYVKEVKIRVEVNRNGDNSEEKAKNSGGEVNRGVKEVQKK